MKKLLVIVVMAMACISSLTAQTTDKRLLGAWIMESMQFDGEEKILCGSKETPYTQFKFYGADGEYACAEIVRQENGEFVVIPHEYGTYTYKNGVYSEMGRPAVAKEDMVLIDKDTFKGRWANRNDVWKKKTNLSKEAIDYIITLCKMAKQKPSAEVQKSIEQSMFSR